jgi:REP element-mobilizing transposase RayT
VSALLTSGVKIQMTKFNPDLHHRHSIRLRGYDYSQEGAYFITICTQNRECLFGEIRDCEMILNDAGKMIEKWWAKIVKKFPSVETDEYVVMPNHFHGIVVIVGADPRVRPDADVNTGEGAHMGAPLQRIIQWFKTMSTNEYIQRIKQNGWQPLSGKLWQRNYYEHIIRNERELDEIREYIVNNPLQWALDNENPERICL